MEMSRMLDVVKLRFSSLRPVTRVVNEEKFIIEMDNLSRTARIAIRGSVDLDNTPKYHIIDLTMPDGRIEPATESEKVLIEDVKKAVQQALM